MSTKQDGTLAWIPFFPSVWPSLSLVEPFELASVAEEDLEHSHDLKELANVLHQQRTLLFLGFGL